MIRDYSQELVDVWDVVIVAVYSGGQNNWFRS